MHTRHLCLASLLAFVAPLSARAYTTTEPKTGALTTAAARRDKLGKLWSVAWSGTVKVTESGDIGHFEDLTSMPQRTRFSLLWSTDSYIMEVNNGRVTETSNAGMHEVTGTEKDQELLDATFDADLRWQEVYPGAELTGVVDFEGTKAYAVKLVTKDGLTRIRYFDVETVLPIGEDREIALVERHRGEDNGPQKFVTRMVWNDFRTVDGCKFAHRWTRRKTAHTSLPEMIYTVERLNTNSVRWD
jgi:hypothetical protein